MYAYVRVCALPGSELVVLLGEATFHQIHGGIATNARLPEVIKSIFKEYEEIRGEPFSPPQREPVYFGRVHKDCLRWLGLLESPFDVVIYGQLIARLRPRVIIEIGIMLTQ